MRPCADERAFSAPFEPDCDSVPQMEGGDYERNLGVIEAITLTSQQCPNGSVRTSAERALETIRKEGGQALPAQAYLLLTSIRGWRGARASQINRSLQSYLAEDEASRSQTPNEQPSASTSSSTPSSREKD